MKHILALLIFFVSPAFAQETHQEATVTLTANELNALVAAEIARIQAAPAMQKVQAAFSPKPAQTPAPKIEERK